MKKEKLILYLCLTQSHNINRTYHLWKTKNIVDNKFDDTTIGLDEDENDISWELDIIIISAIFGFDSVNIFINNNGLEGVKECKICLKTRKWFVSSIIFTYANKDK